MGYVVVWRGAGGRSGGVGGIVERWWWRSGDGGGCQTEWDGVLGNKWVVGSGQRFRYRG